MPFVVNFASGRLLRAFRAQIPGGSGSPVALWQF